MKDGADARKDMIDTSDVEEKEIMEAMKPGYYDRVWGLSNLPSGQTLELGISDYPGSCNKMSPPQTPSHEKLQAAETFDPSSILIRLEISPTSRPPEVHSIMSMTTPVFSAPSSSPSTTLFPPESSSSPDLGGFETDGSQPSIKANDRNLLVDAFGLNVSSNSPHDSICLASPRIMLKTDTNEITLDSSFAIQVGSRVSLQPTSSRIRVFPESFSSNSMSSSSGVPPGHAPDTASSIISRQGPLVAEKPLLNITTDSPSHSGSPRSKSEPALFLDLRGPRRFPDAVDCQSHPSHPLSPLSSSPSMIPSFSRHSQDRTPHSPTISLPYPEPQHRTYSLRHRSAKQLNPFEYDKRQYTRQLRGMPEAIVKGPNLRRVGRRGRYDGEGENDWEQGEADDNVDERDNGNNEWRARERHREKQVEREALKVKMRELGMALGSSEDDEVYIRMSGDDAQQRGEVMKGEKRKRGPRIHRFPMATKFDNAQASSLIRQTTPRSEQHSKPRPRPRPNYHGPSPTFRPQKAVSIVTSDDPQVDVGQDVSDDSGDSKADPWHVQTQEVEESDLPLKHNMDTGKSSVPIDSSEDEQSPNPRRGRLKLRNFDKHGPDVQILEDDTEVLEGANTDQASRESEDPEDVVLTGKTRRQLKALRRMMPAALRNKILANQEEKTKQRTKEYSRRQESDASDAPLQPGRGHKRIVNPSFGDPKRFEIKGDTESESESSGDVHTSNREVVVVHDDGSEEDAERALEEGEDDLDDEDIQTWLAPEPQEADISYEAKRMHRPDSERDKPRGGDLIDRMLQRTRRVWPRLPRTGSGRKPQTKGPRPSRIEVITKDARKLGAGGGRQTQLAFPKADRKGGSLTGIRQEQSPVVSSKHGNRQHRTEEDERCKDKRNKKRKRAGVQSNLYIIHRDNYGITSGRPRQIIHVDDDDDAFHDALAPVESTFQPRVPQPKTKDSLTHAHNIPDRLSHVIDTEPDAFDVEMNMSGQLHSKISLDFDMVTLPSGLTLGPDSYIGKGRLYDLISVLKANKDVPLPFTVNLLGLQIDPNMPVTQITSIVASACDKLYDASIMAVDDQEYPMIVKAADALMHALCHMVTFKALRVDDNDRSLFVTVISEQLNHLIARINERVELISADGHNMDYRSFVLYWFSVEMHLRLVYAYQQRDRPTDVAITNITTNTAEHHCVQLLRRLLEYGFDRTLGLLQNGHFNSTTLSNLRALELWSCIFHIAPYMRSLPVNGATKPIPSFWRMVEAAMDTQINKPDSQLYESERIWRTIFSLCAVSQFSSEGLSTSMPRLEAYWLIVRKALKCIRLSADVRDNNKPASTLHKRDTYLRMVTARCFLLCTRWHWRLNEADDIFQELCAIFRSRQFSNLLGEPDDFPTFIREGNEAFLDMYQKTDTAFGLFLKLIVRASKDFLQMDGTNRLRGTKLARLLSLAVPVGSTSFTKKSPPNGQGLSMLYNRYSAVFVSIYVDSSANHIRSRLQQVRRYIAFKDADYDSRTAAIRLMMHIAILLRHLSKPLDDILLWASEMAKELIDESVSTQVRAGDSARKERDKLVVLVQLLLGSIRIITNTPSLNRSGKSPAQYPDIGLLQAWMSQILSSPMVKDHRTGLEICKCIQSFLVARRATFPPSSLPKSAAGRNSQESQDEYGGGGVDLSDPALLAVLADIEDRPDENEVVDRNASEILDAFSQPLYSCVCMHLGCKSTTFGGPYYEADQWLECWLSYGSILVRHRKRDWDYYIQLGESAWKDIVDPFRHIHVRIQFMLSILRLDPDVYKSHTIQIQTLWFECVVSPNLTIQHDFTERLFSIDGFSRGIFQNMRCTVDAETGCFSLDINGFKQHRLGFIEAALANVADAWNSGAEQYIPLVETLLEAVQKWINVMNQDFVRRVEYVEFGKRVFLAVCNHNALTRHSRLRGFFSQGGSLYH